MNKLRNLIKLIINKNSGSPDQSDFLLVTDQGPYVPNEEQTKLKINEKTEQNDTQLQIIKIKYHITNDYTNNMFDSCK